MHRLAAVVGVLALVAAACAGSTPAAAPPPASVVATPSPQPVPSTTPSGGGDAPLRATPTAPPTVTPQPTTPPPAPVAPVEWVACADMECATVSTPLDHDAPQGRTIDLALARVAAADPSQRIGSLLLNPGGPGASGIDFLAAFASSAPAELQNRFDLVSWDPRGVGQTTGLTCNDSVAEQINEEVSTLDGIRDDLDRYVADIGSLGVACLAQRPELLGRVGTVDTAKDLEIIRAAVGDDKLTYLGFSYGTRIGAVYATLFPSKVRAMALDGAFPPSLSSTELALNVADLESALTRIDRTCDLEPECGVGALGLIETFNALRDTLDTEPAISPLGLSDRSAMLGATLLAIYVPGAWEVYARALDTATKGDVQLIQAMSAAWFGGDEGQFNDIYFGANTAIMCADQAYPPDLSQTTIDAEAALAASPLLGDLFFGANCVGWPVTGPPLPKVDTEGAPTLVVVGSAHDPATPLRWAERLTADLESAVLVTYTGDGHTVVGNGNACIDNAVTDYFILGIAPESDLTCEPESGLLGLRLSEVGDGLQVQEVTSGSAAAEGGLQAGDVITRINGDPARSLLQTTTTAGEVLNVVVLREGLDLNVRLVAGRRPWMLPPDPEG